MVLPFHRNFRQRGFVSGKLLALCLLGSFVSMLWKGGVISDFDVTKYPDARAMFAFNPAALGLKEEVSKVASSQPTQTTRTQIQTQTQTQIQTQTQTQTQTANGNTAKPVRVYPGQSYSQLLAMLGSPIQTKHIKRTN